MGKWTRKIRARLVPSPNPWALRQSHIALHIHINACDS